MTEMTKASLKQICKDTKLYGTPSINDKLYCHYKGFRRIENLEEYTGLKVIWLEGNGFNKIEGLEAQTKLRTLYMQENLIDKIENLESQTILDSLNLGQNNVSKIENLGHMDGLQTLQLKNNQLRTADDIRGVLECPSISTLDLQHNKIDDETIIDVLEQMPNLRVVYLQGNPAVKKLKWYRKSTISRLKSLKYLDDRPVFDDERMRAEAWMEGWKATGTVEGAREGERGELDRQRAEKKAKEVANFKAFDRMVAAGREEAARKAKATAHLGKEHFNIFSGEMIVSQTETPAGEALRQQMWGDTVNDDSLGKVNEPVMTKKQKEERAKVLEACATVGDGTFHKNESDYKARYEAAKQVAQERVKELGRMGGEQGADLADIKPKVADFSSRVNAAQEEAQKDVKETTGGGLFNQSFVASLQEATPAPTDGSFIAVSAFDGAKAGYVYTTGEHGSGYYREQSSSSSDGGDAPALFDVASEDIVAKLAAAPPAPPSKSNNEGQKKNNAPEVGVSASTDMEELD
jgi:dynein assembly factor 1